MDCSRDPGALAGAAVPSAPYIPSWLAASAPPIQVHLLELPGDVRLAELPPPQDDKVRTATAAKTEAHHFIQKSSQICSPHILPGLLFLYFKMAQLYAGASAPLPTFPFTLLVVQDGERSGYSASRSYVTITDFTRNRWVTHSIETFRKLSGHLIARECHYPTLE